MIDTIKLVAGFAHSDKSNILSNILFSDGYVYAQNDLCGISLKSDIDIEFCCNASRLLKSVNNCDPDNIKFKVSGGKIVITSGRFRSKIDIIDVDSYPDVKKSGDDFNIQNDIFSVMDKAAMFSDPNDVRIALRGVELSSGHVSSTNGHVAVMFDIEPLADFDSVVIPSKSIQLMSKANCFIDSFSTNKNIAFFNFEDGFLFSRTIDQKMPDIKRIISEIEIKTDLLQMVDPIKSIAPMCDADRVVVLGDEIMTRSGDAKFDGFNFNKCAFNVDYLIKINSIADSIDFSKYPSACPFNGDGVNGAVVGVKL